MTSARLTKPTRGWRPDADYPDSRRGVRGLQPLAAANTEGFLQRVEAGGREVNTYIAFYRGRQVEVEAETSYAAQFKAAITLKARKIYDVRVMLAKTADGNTVVHRADF